MVRYETGIITEVNADIVSIIQLQYKLIILVT
jgi:hypothetical protein